MKGKLALLVGASVGYVLGTRDGRQRYEQLKRKAEDLWQDPKVQDKVSQARQVVSLATGSAPKSGSGEAAGDSVGGAAVQVSSKSSGPSKSTTGSTGSKGPKATDTSKATEASKATTPGGGAGA